MGDLTGGAFSDKRMEGVDLWECRPRPSFQTISLTGGKCALNCDFCGGRFLRDMISVEEPRELYDSCVSMEENGVRGVLLSGGFNERGYVPFEPFLEDISLVSEETDLFVSVHTGLVPKRLARELGSSGVDAAYFDFLTDNEVICSRLGLDRSARDYRITLSYLIEEIPHVVPHLLLGLSGGDLGPEMDALKELSDLEISGLTLLVIIPPGTEAGGYNIPSPEDIGEFVAHARLDLPEKPLALGCMRPRWGGRVSIEVQAIRSGIDRLAVPSEESLQFAREVGLVVRELKACCGVPRPEMGRFLDG